MADFPENPSVGDVFVASDFTSWFWDGYHGEQMMVTKQQQTG